MNWIRKSTYLLLILFVSSNALRGQYWQQYVAYDMDVKLDTETKTITAVSNLLYVNNAPDTLSHIYMHLYPNAFNAGTIAEAVWNSYGDPLNLEKGWTGITIDHATRDSTDLKYLIRDDTILDITLDQALPPGDTLGFSLDWNYLIHPHIDRSGWQGQQFDLAQWYPKFVVYDETGWHDDPFGDWGEFYGEFGDFTVHLDLPESQIVGATGVVIDGDPGWSEVTVDTSKDWNIWLENFEKARETLVADRDSTARRQVTFLAENVHDFAWLCSPDFVHEQGEWNGITVNALFTTTVGEDWTKSVVGDGISAIRWLSEKFGGYPWPQMTITKALLGGGMEYPMLIMDASDSEGLIVHEIGHNWFYGLFGNDELDDAWLDEGFTTFQTCWYQEVYYPENGYALTRKYITPFEAEHLPRSSYLEQDLKPTICYMQAPWNEPIATRSYDFVNYNSYRSNVYTKASLMLHILKNYLGEARFLAGMQLYYQRWALKHVREQRFIKAMEDASGEELDWFFDQWLHTTHYLDYALTDWDVETFDNSHYRTSIEVSNQGGMFAPIPATIYGADGISASASLREFRFRQKGTIQIESDFKPVRVVLDPQNIFFDTDRRNNDSQTQFAFRYNYKNWEEYPDDRDLYLWKPQVGYSDTHGLGMGLRIDRVYRNPGNSTTLEIDHNFGSANPDMALSFRKQQLGLPFAVTWSGKAASWHSLTVAALQYELNWAKIFWKNPIHYLTLMVDFTDAEFVEPAEITVPGFTRIGLKYELQHDLFHGDYGLSVNFSYSPSELGAYGRDFSQIFIMDEWNCWFGDLKIKNRSNFAANSSATPALVKTRVASQNLRNIHLNRLASSLYQTAEIEKLGSRFYLAGGGRFRAYTDSLDTAINYLWSNNLDLSVSHGRDSKIQLDFGTFLDMGQVSDDAVDWEWKGDAGLSLALRPTWKRNSWFSTIIRPFSLKLELPLIRYVGKEYKTTLADELWVFTLSL